MALSDSPLSEKALNRLLDSAFGLSALSWAAMAIFRGHAATLVGLTIVVLNATAGLLFLLRRPAVELAAFRDNLLCVGSILISGVALKVAPPFGQWPLAAAILFSLSGLGAIASLAVLGRSFGIFPAIRGVVGWGPFGQIRHPIYAFELLMVLSCAMAAEVMSSAALVFAATVALTVVRIQVEERLLGHTQEYRSYCQRVRYRLLIGIW